MYVKQKMQFATWGFCMKVHREVAGKEAHEMKSSTEGCLFGGDELQLASWNIPFVRRAISLSFA